MTDKLKRDTLRTAYKMTSPDGTDFYTGKISYLAAYIENSPIEVADADPPLYARTGNVCGKGIHVCETPKQTCHFGDNAHRPWRWWEVLYLAEDEIEKDDRKIRVRRLEKVVREITLAEIFGPDFGQRIERVQQEVASWKSIPWLQPDHPVTDAELKKLFLQWHKAITLWLCDKSHKLPKKLRVVQDRAAADAAAIAAASNADADAADAAAYAADAAIAADAAAIAADAASDADAIAAASDADADAIAADAIALVLPWWWRWYVRPHYVLRRHARWKLAGMEEPSPWEPIVTIYRLGCLPIGYVKGEFIIYVPNL